MVHDVDLEMLEMSVEHAVLADAVNVTADGDGEARSGEAAEGTLEGVVDEVVDAQYQDPGPRHGDALDHIDTAGGNDEIKIKRLLWQKLIMLYRN